MMFGREDPEHRTATKTLNFACIVDGLVETNNGLKRPWDLDSNNDLLVNQYGTLCKFKAPQEKVFAMS